MIIVMKFILAFIVGLPIGYLLLLSSRDALCVDIEESTGRYLFKNKKKKGKKYPNRLKWFFLWDHLDHVRKWHYVSFVLDIFFSILSIVFIALIFTGTDIHFFWNVGIVVFLITFINKLIITSFPWGRFRN